MVSAAEGPDCSDAGQERSGVGLNPLRLSTPLLHSISIINFLRDIPHFKFAYRHVVPSLAIISQKFSGHLSRQMPDLFSNHACLSG